MKEKLLQDSLHIAKQKILELQSDSNNGNVWLWIALIEFIIIFMFFFKYKNKAPNLFKNNFKKEALSQNVDFDNIINSSFHSLKLYDELKVKCHPDLFINDKEKNDIALSIFQEITKNKTNLKQLEELKKEAENKLNITF